MNIQIREFCQSDLSESIAIWNRIVTDGNAFPQTDCLDETTGLLFFQSQSYTGVACDRDTGTIAGLYILHPNNVGHCGHICNASYAVRADIRGQHIGERLVKHCMERGRELGFKILQFNAVVTSNTAAIHLYKKLGFTKLGTVPEGFRMDDGTYQDILLYYHPL